MYVELSSDAVTQGKLSGVSVTVDGQPGVAFEKVGGTFRASLAAVDIEAGFSDAKDQKNYGPSPLELVVEIRGESPGSALMMVRVGPLEAEGTTGSALQGRMFAVS